MTSPTFESVVESMAAPKGSSALLLVLDGLGGYQNNDRCSELTAASTPNLNQLAGEGSLGLHDPVGRGITPGSGAGHLGLFGYDPLVYNIGRGALSAAGLGFDLLPGDVAARVNVCTLAADGTVADRRAGRLPTSETADICRLLTKEIALPNVQLHLIPEQDHRALMVLRGEDLSEAITDTDPQAEGIHPLTPQSKSPSAAHTAHLLVAFLDKARALLSERTRGNFLLLRGFDGHTQLPSFASRFQTRPVGIAIYPTYLGISRLLGFETCKVEGGPADEVKMLSAKRSTYDFFFVHIKGPDSAGEDGDFDRKVAAIEEVDALLPAIRETEVGVIAITGDHSTPSQMAAHSWHPVPVLLWGGTSAADRLTKFDEIHCRQGSLGRFKAKYLMPQVLAAAGRLSKYGA